MPEGEADSRPMICPHSFPEKETVGFQISKAAFFSGERRSVSCPVFSEDL
jgi:hypothetical protein